MKSFFYPLILVVACAGLIVAWSAMEVKTSAQVTAGREQNLEARVDGTVREAGTLESANPLHFHCLVPGQTTILSLAENGSYVQKGDLLVELDGSSIQEQIQQQQIAAITAESGSQQAQRELELAKLEAETALAAGKTDSLQHDPSADRMSIELEIKTQGKRLAVLEKKIELVSNQQSSNVESTSEALKYQLMLLDFQTEAELTKEKLDHLKSNVLPRQETLQTQQSKLIALQQTLRKVKSEGNTQQALAELKARQTVAKAELQRLDHLQQQLKNCRIVAPRDGIVAHANQTSRRAEPAGIEKGATVRERQALLHMPDLEHLQMNVQVHESKIARVKTGQSATIRFDAFPNQNFSGSVTAIADTPLPGAWPNLDVKQYEVIVSLDQADPRLKIGLTGLVEIDVTK